MINAGFLFRTQAVILSRCTSSSISKPPESIVSIPCFSESLVGFDPACNCNTSNVVTRLSRLIMSAYSSTLDLIGLPCSSSSASLAAFRFSPVGSAIFALTGLCVHAAIFDGFLFDPAGSAAFAFARDRCSVSTSNSFRF